MAKTAKKSAHEPARNSPVHQWSPALLHAALKRVTPAQSRRALVDAGIVDENGALTAFYKKGGLQFVPVLPGAKKSAAGSRKVERSIERAKAPKR